VTAYGDSETYKRLYDKSSNKDDDDIVAALEAVADYLDERLGYPEGFFLDQSPTSRVYLAPADGYGRAERELVISPIASRVGLAVKINYNGDGDFDGEDDLATSDYELWPLNADKGRRPRPWTALVLPSWSSVGAWPVETRVQVMALHGWPGGVPNAIVQASYELTAILRLESPRAERTMTDLNQTFSTSTRANRIVDDLVMVYAKAGGITVA
jgi:hypothetical protein